jgi:kinesin family protein 6/9
LFAGAQAKNGGKRIEEIRSKISYHKEAIEKLRRNHAINMISRTEEKLPDNDNLASEEKYHSDAINREKLAYNETLEYLRKLKGNIENTQKVVEKARNKMQTDFDVWYREMCSRERVAPLHHDDNNPQQSMNSSKESHMISRTDEQSAISTTKVLPRPPPPPAAVANNETKKEEEEEFQLPPGIKLTGNREADDDIIAFFKAKQVLLSRSLKK